MTILPSISPLALFGLSGLAPVSSPAAARGGSLSLIAGGSTFVQLSAFGRFLSAVATFQNRLAVLQPGASDSGIGRNFGTDFGSLAAEAQHFVDSFNDLQQTLNGLGFFATTAAAPSATQLTARLQEQLGAALDNGGSALSRLADIGIEAQPSFIPGAGGSLGIDLAKLRAAFDADPQGSFSLLARAVETFTSVATEVTASSDGVNSLLAAQLQFSSLQLTLGLFDRGDSSQGGLQGLTDLLTLASLGNGGPASQARVVAALTEFSFISSLLG